jgi:hypothetical protein
VTVTPCARTHNHITRRAFAIACATQRTLDAVGTVEEKVKEKVKEAKSKLT